MSCSKQSRLRMDQLGNTLQSFTYFFGFVGSGYYNMRQHFIFPYTVMSSTMNTHCGMGKIVVDLNVHAVILQTFRGSARNFLSQLLTTWSSASVGMRVPAFPFSFF